MGISVPGAIAAKLIYPEKKVLAVSGDGGFMMNCQEMETALRIGVPIVVMIFNDSGYADSLEAEESLRFPAALRISPIRIS